MRELLLSIEPTWWSEVSAVVFTISFVLLVVWVYLPSRRRTYEHLGALPLSNDEER